MLSNIASVHIPALMCTHPPTPHGSVVAASNVVATAGSDASPAAPRRMALSRQQKQQQLTLKSSIIIIRDDSTPPASPSQEKNKLIEEQEQETPEVVETAVPSTALPGHAFTLQLNNNNAQHKEEIQVQCPIGARPGDRVIVVVQQPTTPFSSSSSSSTDINNHPHRALLLPDATSTTAPSTKQALLRQRKWNSPNDQHIVDDLKSTALAILRPTIVPFERYRHLMVGAFVSVTSNEAPRSFSYYKLRLSHIQRVFKDLHIHWNTKHPAAQKIYGPGATAVVIRKAIRIEKQGLYGRGIASVGRGDLSCARDLLMLFDMGLRRGRSTMFTYVIDDDAFRCSETGVSFSKDYMSKHAVHAGAKPNVRFAGEFFFAWADEPEEGEQYDNNFNNDNNNNNNNNNNNYNNNNNINNNFTRTEQTKCLPCLVIDNNSGTFAPNEKYLPLLRELMQSNFPDLDVKALDRESSELKVLKERMFGNIKEDNNQWPTPSATAAAAAEAVRVKASSVTKGFSWPSTGFRFNGRGGVSSASDYW